MNSFHHQFPRVFDRVPFVAYCKRTEEITVGYGRYALNFGKWFIILEFC